MTKKRNNILLMTTLAAGTYAYFSKKENRDKAQVLYNNLKKRIESYMQHRKFDYDSRTKVGFSDPYNIPDNKMVSEGAQTSVHYYNQEVEDEVDVSKNTETDGLYNKK